jgi:SET domain-containing protein
MKGFTNLGNLEVRYVDGKGRGVFALSPIKGGSVVEHSPFIRISTASYSILSYTNLYNYFFYDPENEDGVVVGLGYSSLYNHAKKPNCDWHVTDDGLLIVSNRDIKKDEEITLNYGWDQKHLKEEGIK